VQKSPDKRLLLGYDVRVWRSQTKQHRKEPGGTFLETETARKQGKEIRALPVFNAISEQDDKKEEKRKTLGNEQVSS